MLFQTHLTNQQRNRAVATVIPYTNNTTLMKSASPVLPCKPLLTLQESGIFEEEEHEDEKSLLEVKLANRSTQTDTPSGELLQEVQRLQELRARIQERAAKITTSIFHPIDSSKIYFDVSAVDSIVQLTSYQERIRDLEERLEIYKESEKDREKEKQLSKQREEELLDENYRLTEKIYWLKNKLQNIAVSSFKENEHKDGTLITQQIKNIEHNKYQILETLENLKDVQNRLKNTNCTQSTQTIETSINMNVSRCQDQNNVENFNQQIVLGAQCNITVRNLQSIVYLTQLYI